MNWRVLPGDVRAQLQTLPAASVQTCVTSPPYWGLRDYGHDGQLGLEPTPDAYVASMVAVFAEVRRVLKDDGTVWLNLGDSYANNASTSAIPRAEQGNGSMVFQIAPQEHHDARRAEPNRLTAMKRVGLKHKDLVGVPWRVAFALQADGWYLRSDIIWSKPNPMPESVTDRPTRAHEYIFLLSKAARYYYDAAAIKEPAKWPDGPNSPQSIKSPHGQGFTRKNDKQRGHGRRHAGFNDRWDAMPKDEQQALAANKRSVWHVATCPYPDAHFATYPEKLIEPCILAGSRIGDTVLDPFTGSGTTGAVAVRHQRSFVGCELNPEYVALARRRIGSEAPLFAEEATA